MATSTIKQEASLTATPYTEYVFNTYTAADTGISAVYIVGKLCIFALSFIYTADYIPSNTQVFVNKMPKPLHDVVSLGSTFNGSVFIPCRFKIIADPTNTAYGQICNHYGVAKTFANCPTIVTGCYVIA